MSVNTFECCKQLENQMENMCNYLEKLVTSDDCDVEESNYDHNIAVAQGNARVPDVNKQTYKACIAGGFSGESPPAPFVTDTQSPTFNYGLLGASPQYALNMVTSVLANDSNISSSTPRFVSNSCPRMKKRITYKQSDNVPDTSSIDIDATMIELGLTPESLTQNKVHKLFSLFSNLEFSIHAEFITTTVYDQKTIPNTMSVSAQTKYAIWSCHKLLRSLRGVLKRPMPAEYKSAFDKCEEALSELYKSISNLERFRNCTLEHRRGDFIHRDAEEYLQPLMGVLDNLTKSVEKSRMYIQVYERALNAPERYKVALLTSRGDHPQPSPEETYTEAPSCSRPEVARRYIG